MSKCPKLPPKAQKGGYVLKWQEANQSGLQSLFMAVLICFELEHWPWAFRGSQFGFGRWRGGGGGALREDPTPALRNWTNWPGCGICPALQRGLREMKAQDRAHTQTQTLCTLGKL